jgi:hypothetical protein
MRLATEYRSTLTSKGVVASSLPSSQIDDRDWQENGIKA